MRRRSSDLATSASNAAYYSSNLLQIYLIAGLVLQFVKLAEHKREQNEMEA